MLLVFMMVPDRYAVLFQMQHVDGLMTAQCQAKKHPVVYASMQCTKGNELAGRSRATCESPCLDLADKFKWKHRFLNQA
jgi:hypothetical protein